MVADRLNEVGLSYGQGFEDAYDEALRIVYAGADINPATEFTADIDRSNHQLNAAVIDRIDKLTARRINTRKPLAYLLHEAWFCGTKFYVDERAIIPRSYVAEWIPEQFQPWVEYDKVKSILDLCCGSGCIAISCAMAFSLARIVASDISSEALGVAKINIEDYDLGGRIELHQGNGFDGIKQAFDLIICNPPYVTDVNMRAFPNEYRQEPKIAFYAGSDGLDFIIPLLCEAGRYLTSHGVIVIESGSASLELEKMFPQVPFLWLSTENEEKVLFLLDADQLNSARNSFVEALNSRNY